MPDQLRRLCDFLDQTDYPLRGNMKLRPEGEGLKGWFGADSAAWHQLAGFGAGPDVSTLALWLYAGRDPSIAPVVHLGSEGDQLIVLANNFFEFLHLFGMGYTELGFDDLTQPPDEPELGTRLSEWLKTEFDIDPQPPDSNWSPPLNRNIPILKNGSLKPRWNVTRQGKEVAKPSC